MNKHTINSQITKVHRGIAYLLLISQLLTSCDGSAIQQLPVGSSAGGSVEPTATSATEAVPYYNVAGEEQKIQLEDIAHTSVAEFLERIKQQHDSYE